MAIDPKEFDDVRPSSSSVDRLKLRKNRIKPWNTMVASVSAESGANKPPGTDGEDPTSLPAEINTVQETQFPSSNVVQSSVNHSSFIVQSELVQNQFNSSSNVVQSSVNSGADLGQLSVNCSSTYSSNSDDSNIVQSSVNCSSNVDIHRLSPTQQKLMFYLVNRAHVTHSKTSSPFKSAELANTLECTIEGLRTAVKRLIAKDLLLIADTKSGKGGWTRYQLPDSVFQSLFLLSQSSFNPSSIVVQSSFNPSSIYSSNPSSKLVSDNLIETNSLTSDQPWFEISEIDLTPVHSFQITKKQLSDILNQKLKITGYQLQDLVNRFAVYAANPANVKKVQSLPALFMSMAQRTAKGDDPLQGIETAEDQHINELLNQKRSLAEERERRNGDLLKLEFEEWAEALSTLEKEKFEKPFAENGSAAFRAILLKYYSESIWPTRMDEIKARAVLAIKP